MADRTALSGSKSCSMLILCRFVVNKGVVRLEMM
jgi:hypothetical protein